MLIFNFASGEVSFVKEEKTSIAVAFMGEMVLRLVYLPHPPFLPLSSAYRDENRLAWNLRDE